MDVVPTIQTVKNLEVEIRDKENATTDNTSWAHPTIQDIETDYEEHWQAYSEDDELILKQAPHTASTPELAPNSSSSLFDDMDLFTDLPSPTLAQKELAKLLENQRVYNRPCPPSPIAPVIQWSDQDKMDHWPWEDCQKYCDEQDIINNNTEWLYVPLLPLCTNITLIDPSSVDLSEDPVDSGIINCTCEVLSVPHLFRKESPESSGVRRSENWQRGLPIFPFRLVPTMNL
jgi:hypothetical protein